MANLNEMHQGGFFTGATELAKELINVGQQLNEAKFKGRVQEIFGDEYFYDEKLGEHVPVKKRKPEEANFPWSLTVFSLSGFVDYIKSNVEGLVTEGKDKQLILHIENERRVSLLSHPSPYHKKRHTIVECSAKNPEIIFGKYMDSENFNTMLLTRFNESAGKDEVFKLVKNMVKEQKCDVSDDGVSQKITVKAGVSLASNVIFKNPVPLRPMRTFHEVEQPESVFTLRVNDNAEIALFEADGGAWRFDAVKNIKKYLEDNLKGANVVVIG